MARWCVSFTDDDTRAPVFNNVPLLENSILLFQCSKRRAAAPSRTFAGRVSESFVCRKRANAPLFHNRIKIGDNVLSTLLAHGHIHTRNTYHTIHTTSFLFEFFTIYVFIVFCIVKCIFYFNKLFEKTEQITIYYIFSTYASRYSNPKTCIWDSVACFWRWFGSSKNYETRKENAMN